MKPSGRALSRAAGLLLGLATPLLLAGRAPFAGALIVALLAVVLAPSRAALFRVPTRAFKEPLALALIALLAVWLLSSALSLDPAHSFEMVARSFALVVAGGVLARFLAAHPEAGALALKSLVAAAFLAAALAVVGRYGVPEVLGLVRGRGWVEPSMGSVLKAYGSVAACLLPVVLWAGWRLRSAWRALGLLHAPLAVAVMIGGPSHAGLFGAAVMAGFAICALGLKPGVGLNAALALISAALLAGVGLALAQIPTLPAPESLGERVVLEPFDVGPPAAFLDAHRQAIWGFARDRALEAPVVGHGPDVSNQLPGARTVIEGFEQEFIPGHPHNWALELFVDTGAVGVAAVLVVLALLVRRLARAEVARPERAAGLALFGAFWGSSFFNFSFWENWWQTTLLVLLVLIAGQPRSHGPALARAPESGKNGPTPHSRAA